MTAVVAPTGGPLVGSVPTLESSLGFAEVRRAALWLLIENLDDEIDAVSEKWAEADLRWQEILGYGPAQVDVQHVPKENYHEGPHTSILKAPPVRFPAVSAMAYYTQDNPDRPDQVDSNTLRLFIEAFVISGPVSDDAGSEEEHTTVLHRRAERTAEAIHAVIGRNKTLCNTAKPGIIGDPRGGIGGQSFLQTEEPAQGANHMWQGIRFEYTVRRHHTAR